MKSLIAVLTAVACALTLLIPAHAQSTDVTDITEVDGFVAGYIRMLSDPDVDFANLPDLGVPINASLMVASFEDEDSARTAFERISDFQDELKIDGMKTDISELDGVGDGARAITMSIEVVSESNQATLASIQGVTITAYEGSTYYAVTVSNIVDVEPAKKIMEDMISAGVADSDVAFDDAGNSTGGEFTAINAGTDADYLKELDQHQDINLSDLSGI